MTWVFQLAIPGTKSPASTFKSLETIIKTALNNERIVTKAIHKIVEAAHKKTKIIQHMRFLNGL